MNREEFSKICDGFSAALSLPVLAGQAKGFMFKKFENITNEEGRLIFSELAEYWTSGWFPKPADFTQIINRVMDERNQKSVIKKFHTDDSDRPTTQDWENFEKTISKICVSKSIPKDESEYDPVAAIDQWEKNREDLHRSINFLCVNKLLKVK